VSKHECPDRSARSILMSWRYDLSGVPVDMRRDLEAHLEECAHCRSRRQFHRRLDIVLGIFAGLLGAASFAALVWFWHAGARHQGLLGVWEAVSGRPLPVAICTLSLFFAVGLATLVATATPAPAYLGELAVEGRRDLERGLKTLFSR